MAADLRRAGTACLALSETLPESLCPSLEDITSVVVERLGTRPAPDRESDPSAAARTNRQAVISALMSVAAAAVSDARRGTRRDAARLAAAVSDGSLTEELTRCYDTALVGVSGYVDVDATADELRRCGLDATRLLDGIIRHEAGRHSGLVWHQVNRVVGNYPGYVPDELFGYGWRGLCAALRNYDPSRGISFSTYACTRICGHIADGVRAESPIPKRLNTWYRKVGSTMEELASEHGRPPTTDELATALATDRLTRELGRPASLAEVADALESERKQLHLLPRLSVPAALDEAPVSATSDDPADDAVRDVMRLQVREALDELPDDERFVITAIELEGCSIDECARRLGASTRQVRTLRQRGRSLLAEALSDWRDELVVV